MWKKTMAVLVVSVSQLVDSTYGPSICPSSFGLLLFFATGPLPNCLWLGIQVPSIIYKWADKNEANDKIAGNLWTRRKKARENESLI